MEVQTARSVIVQTGGRPCHGSVAAGAGVVTAGNPSIPNPLVFAGGNGPANAGALYYAGWYGTGPYSSTFSGPVTLNGTTGFGTGGGNVIVSGTIGGTGGLTVLGGNVLNLTGTNTFTERPQSAVARSLLASRWRCRIARLTQAVAVIELRPADCSDARWADRSRVAKPD